MFNAVFVNVFFGHPLFYLVEHSIEQPFGPNFQVILDLTRGPVILGNYQHSLLAAIMGKLFYFFLNFNTSYDILSSNS